MSSVNSPEQKGGQRLGDEGDERREFPDTTFEGSVIDNSESNSHKKALKTLAKLSRAPLALMIIAGVALGLDKAEVINLQKLLNNRDDDSRELTDLEIDEFVTDAIPDTDVGVDTKGLSNESTESPIGIGDREPSAIAPDADTIPLWTEDGLVDLPTADSNETNEQAEVEEEVGIVESFVELKSMLDVRRLDRKLAVEYEIYSNLLPEKSILPVVEYYGLATENEVGEGIIGFDTKTLQLQFDNGDVWFPALGGAEDGSQDIEDGRAFKTNAITDGETTITWYVSRDFGFDPTIQPVTMIEQPAATLWNDPIIEHQESYIRAILERYPNLQGMDILAIEMADSVVQQQPDGTYFVREGLIRAQLVDSYACGISYFPDQELGIVRISTAHSLFKNDKDRTHMGENSSLALNHGLGMLNARNSNFPVPAAQEAGQQINETYYYDFGGDFQGSVTYGTVTISFDYESDSEE